MAPRADKTARLAVVLNGQRVGRLDRATTGAISFFYDRDWLADEQRSIPISLSLPLRESPYFGAEVSTFFDNLLPDNMDIRRIVAENVGADGSDVFSLLNKIGRDCVGALQFFPEDDDITPPGPPQYTVLSDEEIADKLRNLARAPLGMGRIYEMRDYGMRDMRISIAGMQEKTALLWDKDKGWCWPQGATATTHILKPALGRLPNGLDMTRSVENEHFCLSFCRALGLEVAQSQIVDFDGVRALAVERFDRLQSKDGRMLRIPQEDFCQALSIPSTRKYNSEGGPSIRACLDLLNGSDYAEQDRLAFLGAQIAFWMIGASDGHAKNFSLFLSPGGRYRMTPLYDIMSAQPNYDRGQISRREFRLAMAVGDNRKYRMDDILPRHFIQNAKAANVDQERVAELFLWFAQNAETAWERVIAGMADTKIAGDFPMEIADSIAVAMRLRISQITHWLAAE